VYYWNEIKEKRNNESKRQTTNFHYTESGYKGQRDITRIEVKRNGQNKIIKKLKKEKEKTKWMATICYDKI